MLSKSSKILVLLALAFMFCGTLQAQILILAWNVESGGSDPATIEKQLGEFQADIFALSEVSRKEFDRFARGKRFVFSPTGNDDRLQIIYVPAKFELVRQVNLDDLNDGNHRSPLVAHLKEIATGREFMVVNNHLARGNEAMRLKQAEGLVGWAREQSLPIIAVGDYNFDYDFEKANGNEAFKAFMRDGVWKWVKPKEMVDTNWADRNNDGVDDFPGSMLDFVFVAGPAKDWVVECEVIVREGDFPDGKAKSDHRPIRSVISAEFIGEMKK